MFSPKARTQTESGEPADEFRSTFFGLLPFVLCNERLG